MTTPQTLQQDHLNARRQMVAEVLAELLNMPFVTENTGKLSKFVSAAKPMIRLTLGTEVAELMSVLSTGAVGSDRLATVLPLDQFSEEDLDAICDYMLRAACQLGSRRVWALAYELPPDVYRDVFGEPPPAVVVSRNTDQGTNGHTVPGATAQV